FPESSVAVKRMSWGHGARLVTTVKRPRWSTSIGVVPSIVTVEPGSVRPERFVRNGQTGLVNGVSRLSVGPVTSRVTVPTTGSPTSPQSLIATTCTPQRPVEVAPAALISPSDSVVYAPSLPNSFPGGTGTRAIRATASLEV